MEEGESIIDDSPFKNYFFAASSSAMRTAKLGISRHFKEIEIYDKSIICLPRQGKWTTCNSGINGAKWGNKSDDSATELPADYFWAVLKAEMYG